MVAIVRVVHVFLVAGDKALAYALLGVECHGRR